jgi:hypothetical protein
VALTNPVSLSHSEKGTIVPGYDFLVNSVWPEIVRGLEEKLPSLFNPGDPDAFHQVTACDLEGTLCLGKVTV